MRFVQGFDIGFIGRLINQKTLIFIEGWIHVIGW